LALRILRSANTNHAGFGFIFAPAQGLGDLVLRGVFLLSVGGRWSLGGWEVSLGDNPVEDTLPFQE